MTTPAELDGSSDDQPPMVFLNQQDQRLIAVNGIFLLLLLYAIYLAGPVLIPITIAILLNLVLWPPVRLLNAVGLPNILSSAIVVIAVVAAAGIALYALSGPAQQWVDRTPNNFYKVEQKLRALKKPFVETKRAIERVEEAAKIGEDEAAAANVEIDRPSITDTLFSGTLQTISSVGVVFVLLFFLLSSGDVFLRKLVSVIPKFKDKKRTVEIVNRIRDDISFYLLTVTGVNLSIGAAVVAITGFLGIENAFMWGVAAAIFSYIPYIGPAIISGLLTMEGMLAFDDLLSAFAIPVLYFVVVICANTLALPALLGRRLTLSPVAIFISVIFWGWMWGIPGALLAVPLLASFKILCERISPLTPVAEFLTP